MTWLRIDDGMLDHPKWRRALALGGDEALTVWIRLLSWCSRNLTDGRIPGDMVADVAQVKAGMKRSKALRALEEARLIARGEGEEIVMVDYLQRNPSASQVRAERERKNESQRKRRVGDNEAELHATSEAAPCSVPSHPVPSPLKDLTHTARVRPPDPGPEPRPEEPPAVPGLRVVAARSRVVSMPGPEPPEDYLADALMAGVSREQARSTWEHYWGAGLPSGGVERLNPWLVKRAKERSTTLARASPTARAAPRRTSGSKQPNAGLTGFESLQRLKETS